MKTKLCIGIFLLAATWLRAQTTNDLTALLQQGLFEEQASRNLDAAIADYQSLAAQFDKDRQLAATAVFRLGECYRAQGRTNEAVAQYQRILHDFTDQQTLATLSRQDLVGMGFQPVITGAASSASNPPSAGTVSAEATLLAAQISGIEKLKSDPEEQAQGVFAIFPDEDLKKMLVNVPKLRKKSIALRTNPRLTLNELGELLRAVGPGGEEGIYMSTHMSTNIQANWLDIMENQVQQQSNWISERVNFILETQKARLKVLQSADGTESAQNSDNNAGTSAVADDEDREIARVQQMIQNSPDLINAPSDGSTPLVTAAYNGWLKVAAYLLDHGADVNRSCRGITNTREREVTPLVEAVAAGNKAMAKLLLDRGADINFKSQNEGTSLDLAAQKGFQAVVELLLAYHANVNTQNQSGRTALMSAAGNGQVKMVQMLIAAGAEVNLKDDRGETVLNYAVKTSPEIFKALLDAGADPNTEDTEGRTPLSYAVESNDPEAAKLLLAAKADPNGGKLDAPLLCAIQKQNAKLVEMLLQAGADSNAKGIIPKNDNLNGPSRDGRGGRGGGPDETIQCTPIFLAVSTGQLPMAQLLLKYKADPNDSQTDGRPLIFSALADTNALDMLLSAGAKVESHDPGVGINGVKPNWTPLAAAAWDQNPSAVETLLDHGANPNARDMAGYIPLHWAISLWRTPQTEVTYQIVQLLLNHGTDPNQRNSDGRTPLDFAKIRLSGNGDSSDRSMAGKIAVLLRQHGALDKLPDWDCITVNRTAANFSFPIFRLGTNDWNQFTLLEAIVNIYDSSQTYWIPQDNGSSEGHQVNTMLPFPDLTRVAIVHPSHNSTNETRTIVNVLNETNGINCSIDVSLVFGDTVEIPERDHPLGEPTVGLTGNQLATLQEYVKGNVLLVAHRQKAELSFYRLDNQATLGALFNQPEARRVLTSSSDLSRVKVIRRDPKTNKTSEWILDCSTSLNSGPPGIAFYQTFAHGNPSNGGTTDLRLRDGDVIEVPEKP